MKKGLLYFLILIVFVLLSACASMTSSGLTTNKKKI